MLVLGSVSVFLSIDDHHVHHYLVHHLVHHHLDHHHEHLEPDRLTELNLCFVSIYLCGSLFLNNLAR